MWRRGELTSTELCRIVSVGRHGCVVALREVPRHISATPIVTPAPNHEWFHANQQTDHRSGLREFREG